MISETRTRTVYAVGDIHGCLQLFKILLETILTEASARGEAGRPRIILLGDLIDRGPNSKGVVDLILSEQFRQRFDCSVLRGNHDQWMVESLFYIGEARKWLRSGGDKMLESYGVFDLDGRPETQMEQFLDVFPAAHQSFFRALPLFIREGELFLCHAGVDPNRSLDRQDPDDLVWGSHDFMNHQGDFGARVIHGHVPTDGGQVEVRTNRIAVDTGCGFLDGRLSCAAIAPDGSVRSIAVSPVLGSLDTPIIEIDPQWFDHGHTFHDAGYPLDRELAEEP